MSFSRSCFISNVCPTIPIRILPLISSIFRSIIRSEFMFCPLETGHIRICLIWLIFRRHFIFFFFKEYFYKICILYLFNIIWIDIDIIQRLQKLSILLKGIIYITVFTFLIKVICKQMYSSGKGISFYRTKAFFINILFSVLSLI